EEASAPPTGAARRSLLLFALRPSLLPSEPVRPRESDESGLDLPEPTREIAAHLFHAREEDRSPLLGGDDAPLPARPLRLREERAPHAGAQGGARGHADDEAPVPIRGVGLRQLHRELP